MFLYKNHENQRKQSNKVIPLITEFRVGYLKKNCRLKYLVINFISNKDLWKQYTLVLLS